MPEVWVPTRLQSLTGGQQRVRVPGRTLRQVVNNLERDFPGIRAYLCDEDGEDITPGIAVVIDGLTANMGLLEEVKENSEIHFLPAIGGGTD
ncbi:MAG: molybdopterin synthase sulfur carrier subunit [Dehalococcoidia bacterium]|nr:molybdopterin synthase sulfur carrier subunit [Dehalococcoidia bacterium]